MPANHSGRSPSLDPQLSLDLPLLSPLDLPQPHDLEPLKVAELPPPVALRALLGLRALRPLLVDLALRPALAQGADANPARHVRDLQVREGYVGEGGRVAGDQVGGGVGVFRGDGGGVVDESLRGVLVVFGWDGASSSRNDGWGEGAIDRVASMCSTPSIRHVVSWKRR